MKYNWKQKFFAWVKKHIFRIQSPSAAWYGYEYEWDLIKREEEATDDRAEYWKQAYIREHDARVEEMKRGSVGWISVKDRLPEKEGVYIIYHPKFDGGNGAVFASYFYFPACHWTDPVEEWEDYSGVTHWMPLPEPPKEELKVILSDVRTPPPEFVEAMKGKDLWIGNEAFAKCMEGEEGE